MSQNRFEIEHDRDHWVGYIDGKFACTGDTINEVRIELLNIVYPELHEKES